MSLLFTILAQSIDDTGIDTLTDTSYSVTYS